MRIAKRLISFGIAGVLLSGCVTGATLRGQRFETTQNTFDSAMRWSDFAGAASHLEEKAPAPDLSNYRNVKIVSYDPKQLTMANDLREARVVAEIRYINTRQMRERQILATFHWRYDDKDSRWRLASALPTLP